MTLKDTIWDILAFGVVAVDDLVYVDQFPQPDSKVPVLKKIRQGGGLAGTAMVAAARLGARAAYCGVLGEDELSRYTIEELEREQVDCRPVLRRPEARPLHSVIIVEQGSGRRTVLFSTAGAIEPSPEVITAELICGCKVLFVDNFGVDTSLRAVALAHQYGIPVVADIEARPSPRLPELLKKIDHLILGLAAGSLFTGKNDPLDIVNALSGRERACCVLTAGEHGCWFSEYGGKIEHYPAYQVRVVDTTGCGDVFHGAYAASLARRASVGEAIQLATAAAGLKATRPGGRGGIPDLERVQAFIKENNPR